MKPSHVLVEFEIQTERGTIANNFETYSTEEVDKALERFNEFTRSDALEELTVFPKRTSRSLRFHNDYVDYTYHLAKQEHIVRLARVAKILLRIQTSVKATQPEKVIVIGIYLEKPIYVDPYGETVKVTCDHDFDNLLLGIKWMKAFVFQGKKMSVCRDLQMGSFKGLPMDQKECTALMKRVVQHVRG